MSPPGPVIVQQIGRTIREIKNRGFTVLLVEQNFRFAQTVADRHYVVEHGRVIDMIPSRRREASMDKVDQTGRNDVVPRPLNFQTLPVLEQGPGGVGGVNLGRPPPPTPTPSLKAGGTQTPARLQKTMPRVHADPAHREAMASAEDSQGSRHDP